MLLLVVSSEGFNLKGIKIFTKGFRELLLLFSKFLQGELGCLRLSVKFAFAGMKLVAFGFNPKEFLQKEIESLPSDSVGVNGFALGLSLNIPPGIVCLLEMKMLKSGFRISFPLGGLHITEAGLIAGLDLGLCNKEDI